jgi:hypothetical protein
MTSFPLLDAKALERVVYDLGFERVRLLNETKNIVIFQKG